MAKRRSRASPSSGRPAADSADFVQECDVDREAVRLGLPSERLAPTAGKPRARLRFDAGRQLGKALRRPGAGDAHGIDGEDELPHAGRRTLRVEEGARLIGEVGVGMTATRSSTISASAAPFASPAGAIAPASAAAGSVVGLPSASKAQSAGMVSPFCRAAMTLPRATLESDRSTTTGSSSSKGAAKATGFVPRSAVFPPHGAMAAGVLANISATSPWHASSSTNRPIAPQWCERRMAAKAMPWRATRSGSCSKARSSAGKANPCAASMANAPGVGASMLGTAKPSTLPEAACAAYATVRLNPCPTCPIASAPTSPRATETAAGPAVRERIRASVTSRRASSSVTVRTPIAPDAASGAPVELGHHEFAVAERLRSRVAAVGRAGDHVDQRVARVDAT